jgi:hypothetical protein
MNIHPLSEDLTKLKSEELDRKYAELLERLSLARRMHVDQHIIYQLDLLLNGIEDEKFNRLNIMPEQDEFSNVVIDTDRVSKSRRSKVK